MLCIIQAESVQQARETLHLKSAATLGEESRKKHYSYLDAMDIISLINWPKNISALETNKDMSQIMRA